jgi:Alginate export
MLRIAYAVLLALMPLSSALSAQSACPDSPPPYGLLRQDEDYRYLSNPTCRQDIWDHLKYVPLGSNEDRFITVGGEVREWCEGFRNASWGLGTQDDNGYLLQRLTTYADIHAAPRIRFFVQLTSDIEAGRNGGPRPVIDESKLFFEEGFVDVVLSKARKESLVLRLGRQEFEFGSGRFVDVREGPNVRQAFDGASLEWKTPSWTVDGLTTSPCSTVPASLIRPRIIARRFGEPMRFIRRMESQAET